MSNKASVVEWVNNQLHGILGFTERNLADFIVTMATKAHDSKDLYKKLLENDFPDSMESLSFAQQLLGMLRDKKGSIGASRSLVQSNTNAELMRQSMSYKVCL